MPNAGDRPGRERLGYKLRFLAELKERLDALAAAGKQVRCEVARALCVCAS